MTNEILTRWLIVAVVCLLAVVAALFVHRSSLKKDVKEANKRMYEYLDLHDDAVRERVKLKNMIKNILLVDSIDDIVVVYPKDVYTHSGSTSVDTTESDSSKYPASVLLRVVCDTKVLNVEVNISSETSEIFYERTNER